MFSKPPENSSIASYYAQKFDNTPLDPKAQSYNLQITGDQNRCGYISYGSALLSQVIIPRMKDNTEFKDDNTFIENFLKHLEIKDLHSANILLEQALILNESAQNHIGFALLKAYIDAEESSLLKDYEFKLKCVITSIIQMIMEMEGKHLVTLYDTGVYNIYNMMGISDISEELHEIILKMANNIIKNREDLNQTPLVDVFESVNSFLDSEENNKDQAQLNELARSHLKGLKAGTIEMGWTPPIEDSIVSHAGLKVKTFIAKKYDFHQPTPDNITFLQISNHVSRLLLPSEISLINEKLSLRDTLGRKWP